MTKLHLRITWTALLFVVAAVLPPSELRAAGGIMLDVIVHEILDAEPPESAVIDSVSYPVYFGQTTTMRAGNFVLDATVSQAGGGKIKLAAALYVTGPLPGNRSDEAELAPGEMLVINDIRGKGKSSYGARLVPRPADLPDDPQSKIDDTTQWQTIFSTRTRYFVPKGVLPPLQFLPTRSALDFEFETVLDSLDIDATGPLLVHLSPAKPAGWSLESEYGYAIDPSRYRVVAHHDPLTPEIRPRALILAACYRAWGYAPMLLASGVAGYSGFVDYDVVTDRASGRAIPLDSLANSLNYKRHDRAVADHHAASFVLWLITNYGLSHFHDFYDRATDLSIHRAAWSVYGRTLAELEQGWLGYLKTRKFNREEFLFFAAREMAFRSFESHLELLRKADEVVSLPTVEILRGIGIAQGQLGMWDEAVESFKRLTREYPDEPSGRWLLAEAQRAAGDNVAAWKTYLEILRKNPSDPLAHLRMGDIQWEARRVDSAATLWRRALAATPGRSTTAELRLRLGHYFAERRHGLDSSRANFMAARDLVAPALGDSPTGVSGWIITGEALLGQDSAALALEYLALGELVSDAPIDRGRVHLLRGQCFDKLGMREEALEEYKLVISGKSEAAVARLARKYMNRPYGA